MLKSYLKRPALTGSVSSQAGFTLVEVIAAFVVFALLFTSILQIMQQSLRSTQRTTDYTHMTLWAQSKLDSLGVEEPLAAGMYTGTFFNHRNPSGNRQQNHEQGYRWELTVSPLAIDSLDGLNSASSSADKSPAIDLWEIKLTVFSQHDRRQTRFTTLRSTVAQP